MIRIVALVCFWCFVGLPTLFGQQEVVYEIQLTDVSLKTVLQELERQYDLAFSYQDRLAEQVVSVDIKTDNLEELLNATLQGTGLSYELIEERYITLFVPDIISTVVPINRFCGRVLDSLSGQPLAYANAYLLRTQNGGSADEQGKFFFSSSTRPTDTIVISYIGYQEQRIAAYDYLKTQCPDIALSFLPYGENLMVVVTDYLTEGIELSKQGFSTNLQPDALPSLPGQVEPEVLQSLQFLPGISSPDGTLSNIHIRGSTPDQNLIMWEDIPIYHTAHYFGSISAFNPYVVDDVDIFRGGFGAAYGGRIAGIIDINTDARKSPGLTGGLGTNLFSAFGYAQAADKAQKHGVSISLRRSLVDAWNPPFFAQLRYRNQQEVLRGNFSPDNLPNGIRVADAFNFWDTQIKYSAQLSERDQLHLAGLFSENSFNNEVRDEMRQQSQIDSMALRHQGWKARWERRWTPRWQTAFLLASTNYDTDYTFTQDIFDPQFEDGGGRRDNEITEQQLRFSSIYNTSQEQQFAAGYQFTRYENDFLVLEQDEEVNLANQSGGVESRLHTLYGSYRSSEQAKTGIQAGLRANYYTNDGELYWEPRLQFWQQFNDNWRLQVAAGQYYQFLSQVVEFKGSNFGIKTPIWVLADDRKVSVLSSTQLQAGIIYQKGTWLVDAQLYAKRNSGLAALSIGFVPLPQQGFDEGSARVNGLDVLVKKRWGSFSSWFSYSLSSVNFEFDAFFDTEFVAPFDQRHQLKWANVLEYQDWTFSLGWQWSSGLPYSFMRDFRLLPNQGGGQPNVQPIYDAFNGERLAAIHQLDASILYNIRNKEWPDWSGVIGLALVNIYDRQNTYEREYFIENRPNAPRRILFEDNFNLGFAPNLVFRMAWK
ncbi:MAG: carboxypeptidase-like regulatory domain-containing protein [Bacteroidota bacterium]